MIKFYKYTKAWSLADISPFAVKVDTYLRLRGLPYTPIVSIPARMPNGKLPVIEYEGRKIADSSFIIAHLEANIDGGLDGHLGSRQKAEARALQSMFEEDLYFLLGWYRWIDPSSWPVYRQVLSQYMSATGMPGFLHPFVLPGLRRGVHKSLQSQGTGRLQEGERLTRAGQLVSAAAHWLGESPYFLGERVTTMDATTYAFLSAIIDAPLETALKARVLEEANLVEYCRRMDALLAGSASSAGTDI
jgi:glutathione S-transferase